MSYPATTIAELNPEKPVRAFALPAVTHMAAASFKGAFIYTLVSFSIRLRYIFILGGAVVYGRTYGRVKNVFKLDLRSGEVKEMPPMLEVRADFGAAASDHEIFACGGQGAGYGLLKTCEVFKLSTMA